MEEKRRRNYFDQLFYKQEFKKLLGVRKYNLLILTSILLVGYFALSFLQNYIDNLKVEMENPYTNWVSLDIPNHKVFEAEQIISSFEGESLREEYLLDTVTYYNIQHIEAINEITKQSLGKLRFRSIDTNSKLLERIMEENEIQVSQSELENECWVIINPNIYGTDKRRKDKLFVSILDDKYTYLPIIGSADQLPDNCDVLVSEHMMGILQLQCANHKLRPSTNTNNVKTLLRDSIEVEGFIKDFEEASGANVVYSDIKRKKINEFYYNWLTMSLDTFYDQDEVYKFAKRKQVLPVTDFECNSHKACKIEDPYYLTFNFNSLEKVGELQDYLEKEHGFLISLHDVKSKQNFVKVAKMAMSTSIIIVILSLSSIMLFLYHILESHITRIRKSIGTLKAFGLPNEKIIRSYSVICGKLFLYSSVIALVTLYIFQVITDRLSLDIISVYSSVILFSWVASFVSIFFFCSKILRFMLNKTPGDLIYKR